MIVDSLYPDGSNKNVGNNPPGYLVTAITHFWMRSDVSPVVNSPDSYWLGYISKENLPGMYHTNIMYLDDTDPDNKKIVIKDLTDDDNFPCTYMRRAADYVNYLWAESFHTEYDGVVSDLIGSPYRRYLFNQNYPEYSGLLYIDDPSQTSRQATITAICYIYNMVGDRIYPVNVPIFNELFLNIFSALGSTYIDDLYKFLYMGTGYTLNIDFYDSGVHYSYDFLIKAEDIADGTGMIWDTNNQVQLRFFIVSFDFGTGGALRNGSAITFAPSFMAKITGHDAEHTISVLRDGHGCSGYDEKINFANNFYGGTPARYENPVFTYGYKGDVEFDYDAVWNLDDRNNVPYIYTDIAICFAYDGGKWFLPYYNLDDVKRAFSLFYRVCRSNVDSYVPDVSYATDVTPDNEFLARLKTGDKDDPEFIESLREWQYDKFTDNDFTEEDVPHPSPGPEPRPEPVDPGADENSGDDIDIPETLGVGATLGFVTQYCLNASQIMELGETLWTSFTDPNYWKNYMFSLALDTGSFNTSALLDFFISLRVYPFPLVNVPSYATFGQDMYIGTGTVPLHFTTNLHTINNYCEWISAGSAQIPFSFGDFRDYNQEIILYLPFCGTVQLEPADVLGGTISVKYAVDFATGACTAVTMIQTWDNHHYPIAILPGQIGADVPLSATSAGQIAARLGADVLNVAGILTDGAKGAAGAIAPMIAGAATENPAMIAAGTGQMAGNNVNTVAALAGQALNMATRPGIGAPMLSGGRGFSAFGCPQKCYIQIRRPFYDIPENYDDTEGLPAVQKVQVSACQGLARFVNPDISPIETTEAEKEQIRHRLMQGVII